MMTLLKPTNLIARRGLLALATLLLALAVIPSANARLV
jgi:hypothetical protein